MAKTDSPNSITWFGINDLLLGLFLANLLYRLRAVRRLSLYSKSRALKMAARGCHRSHVTIDFEGRPNFMLVVKCNFCLYIGQQTEVMFNAS